MKRMRMMMDRLVGGVQLGCYHCLSYGPFSLWQEPETGKVYATCSKCLTVYEVPLSSKEGRKK